MKITQDMQGGTVGQLATFIAHALANGVDLDSPIAMKRDRGSTITELTIELALPGFADAASAAGELNGTASGARTRPSRPRAARAAPADREAPVGGPTSSVEG